MNSRNEGELNLIINNVWQEIKKHSLIFRLKQIKATDVLALSISERIQLVEDIWDTIAKELQAIELTEEEKNIIDQRLEAYHKNPVDPVIPPK